jgi:hypothetical protein
MEEYREPGLLASTVRASRVVHKRPIGDAAPAFGMPVWNGTPAGLRLVLQYSVSGGIGHFRRSTLGFVSPAFPQRLRLE